MAQQSIRMTAQLEGGHRVRRLLENAARSTGVQGVAVGFFASARYPDGTPVAAVAAWNEWGTEHIPERPFKRASIKKMEKAFMETIKDNIDTETMSVSRHLADLLGAQGTGIVQDTISDGSFSPNPPNAPATVAMKGSSRTLVDTGRMRQSATWKVIRS